MSSIKTNENKNGESLNKKAVVAGIWKMGEEMIVKKVLGRHLLSNLDSGKSRVRYTQVEHLKIL